MSALTFRREDRFCNHCGARIVTKDLTYGYLADEVSERFLNVENNLIFKTIRDLFLKPKEVIDGYINGTRKRHLNVANYLALAITIGGLQIFFATKILRGKYGYDLDGRRQQSNGTGQ